MNEELNNLLSHFEIPAKRRDLNDFGNVLWLGRNLGLCKVDETISPELIKRTFTLLKEFIRGELKKNNVY